MPEALPAHPPVAPRPAPARSAWGSTVLAVLSLLLGIPSVLVSWAPLLNVASMVLGLVGSLLAWIAFAWARPGTATRVLAVAGLAVSVQAVLLVFTLNFLFRSMASG